MTGLLKLPGNANTHPSTFGPSGAVGSYYLKLTNDTSRCASLQEAEEQNRRLDAFLDEVNNSGFILDPLGFRLTVAYVTDVCRESFKLENGLGSAAL